MIAEEGKRRRINAEVLHVQQLLGHAIDHIADDLVDTSAGEKIDHIAPRERGDVAD